MYWPFEHEARKRRVKRPVRLAPKVQENDDRLEGDEPERNILVTCEIHFVRTIFLVGLVSETEAQSTAVEMRICRTFRQTFICQRACG